MRRSSRFEAGYSLPEMLTVVAIIGVLSLVIVPQFVNMYQSARVKSNMRNFTTDLRKMRSLAAERGVQTKLSYATGGNARTYEMYYGSAAIGTSQTWTKLGSNNEYVRSLDSVINFPGDSVSTPQTFNDVDGDGKLDIIFLPNGSCSMPKDPSDPTKTLSVGSITIKTPLKRVTVQQYQIDINPVGRVLATPK